MAEAVQRVGGLVTPEVTTGPGRTENSVMATTVIGAHGLEHMYAHSFNVILPVIYDALGLVPIQGALLLITRRLTGGLTSMGSGFFVDMFRHRVGGVLAFSMGLIGVGYLLVSVSPSYGLILAALALASAGSALWHPPALGLLARRFPEKRGFFISLHRSMGNVGDWLGPLLVGGLLGVVGWRLILGGGTPILMILAVIIFFILRKTGGPKVEGISVRTNFVNQWQALRQVFNGGGMWPIFIVSAVRGMGDVAVLFVLPLYLSRSVAEGGLDKSTFSVGFHIALLAAPGIVSGPLFGALSDRIGRRSIISFIMGVSVILPVTIALGGSGLWMTLSVALFGLFHFSVNSLTQAAAIDLAEGRGLEATFIGLMWGSNSAFGTVALIAAGILVGGGGLERLVGLDFDFAGFGWRSGLYFGASMFFVGWLVSLMIPATGTPLQQASAGRSAAGYTA
jgi:FSR family fosmidomycin resistance protein-like MFS transporter